MLRSVYFATPDYKDRFDSEDSRVARFKAEMARWVSNERYVEAESPVDADLVLYVETGDFKWKSHAELLSRQEILQQFSTKTLVYSTEDSAAVFLDGLYIHSERPKFDASRQRSVLQTWLYNEAVYQASPDKISQFPAGSICSFRGNVSHRVRQKIISYFEKRPDPRMQIRLTHEWYDHAEDRKRAFVEEVLQSPFVLCPRGLGAFTQRFVEVLALGRVPVLLSDDWVPPADLPLHEVAVVVPEKDMGSIMPRLEQALPQARKMGQKGRDYWCERYAPEARLEHLLDQAFDLFDHLGGRAPTMAEYETRWRSRQFHRRHGWLLSQRLLRRLRKLIIKDPR